MACSGNDVTSASWEASCTSRPSSQARSRADAATAAFNHKGSRFISVAPLDDSTNLNPQALNNTNDMRLNVFANYARGHVVLMAIYDNLGKGASGAAVQNLNLMIGADEAASVNL